MKFLSGGERSEPLQKRKKSIGNFLELISIERYSDDNKMTLKKSREKVFEIKRFSRENV